MADADQELMMIVGSLITTLKTQKHLLSAEAVRDDEGLINGEILLRFDFVKHPYLLKIQEVER